MSLKGNRYVRATEVTFFMNEVATKGGPVSLLTAGSGAALDSAAAVVTYAANSSGKVPIGVLLSDVVNYDLTKQPLNWHKYDEVQLGGKVELATEGWVVTNNIIGTPTAGNVLYLGSSGNCC